jgi:hypothetical protein
VEKDFRSALFLLAAVAFAASFAIHVATYFDVVVTNRWPLAWGVHILVFFLFAYCVMDAKARTGTKGKTPLFTAFGPSAQSLAELAAGVLLFYTLVVFAIDFFEPSEGELKRVDGRPVLSEKGKVAKELTEREYIHLEATQARSFSAIVLFFSGASALELFSLVMLKTEKRV